MNLPVPPGSGESTWLPLVEHLALPVARQYRPQLVLISAGFDAHRADPLAECMLEEGSFARMAAHLRDLGAELGVPVGAVLEGGYDLDALSRFGRGHDGRALERDTARRERADPADARGRKDRRPPLAALATRPARRGIQSRCGQEGDAGEGSKAGGLCGRCAVGAGFAGGCKGSVRRRRRPRRSRQPQPAGAAGRASLHREPPQADRREGPALRPEAAGHEGAGQVLLRPLRGAHGLGCQPARHRASAEERADPLRRAGHPQGRRPLRALAPGDAHPPRPLVRAPAGQRGGQLPLRPHRMDLRQRRRGDQGQLQASAAPPTRTARSTASTSAPARSSR